MIGALTLTRDQRMPEPPPPGGAPIVPSSIDPESSFVLVQRAHQGDERALEELCARYLPRLMRWAHGRLPASARGATDTVDLVQDTFIQVLRRLNEFEPRHAGAFQAYLRRTLMNRIHDHIRSARRRGPVEALNPERPATDPSPLEEAIGHEAIERFETALDRLREVDREIIIMRIEMGCSYSEIMEAFGKPSIAAAHMAVSRALVRLAEEMAHGRA